MSDLIFTEDQRQVLAEIIEALQAQVVIIPHKAVHDYLPGSPVEINYEVLPDGPIFIPIPDADWIPRTVHFRLDGHRLLARLDHYMQHRAGVTGMTYAVEWDH